MEYSAALGDYSHAAGLKPSDHRPHQRMGSIYLTQGRLPEAEDSLRQALDLNPDEVEALTDLGQVLSLAGHQEEAVALWKGAASLPKSSEARHHLGMVALEAGEIGQARDELILGLERLLVPCRHRLNLLAQAVKTNSPLAVLERGYAVVNSERTGQVLLSSQQINPAEIVKIRLHQGRLRAEVKEKEE